MRSPPWRILALLAVALRAMTASAEEVAPAPPPSPPQPPSFPNPVEPAHDPGVTPEETRSAPSSGRRAPPYTRRQTVGLAAISGLLSLGSFSVNWIPSPKILGVHGYYDYATALAADGPLVVVAPEDGLPVGGVQVGSLAATIALRYGKDHDGTVRPYWSAVDNINIHLSLWATYATYRDMRLRGSSDAWDDRWQPATASALISAPFRVDNLKHPLVYVPLTLEVGGTGLIAALSWRSESFSAGPAARDALLGTAASFSAGVTEEAIFRGVLYEELKLSMPGWAAHAIDASAFSLWHVPGEIGNTSTTDILAGLATRGAFGVLAEYAYDQGGLAESAALHTLWDTTIFLVAAVTSTTPFAADAVPARTATRSRSTTPTLVPIFSGQF